MKFDYSSIMKLVGFTDSQIQYFEKNTGYGNLYHNYKLSEQYIKSQYLKDQVIPINQCNHIMKDPNQQNAFVIFESNYLPTSFIQTINTKTGYVLVNSEWMRNVVLDQSKCDPKRIVKIPYLENFKLLDKYKKVNVNNNSEILKFYCIADSKDVKGLNLLYAGFNLAFGDSMDVKLTIKTTNWQMFQKNYKSTRNKYLNIEIINGMIPEVQIYKLHKANDVYVSTAFAVGWQIPLFQAAYFGNLLMCGNHSAYTQWVDFSRAIQLESYSKQMQLREYSNGRFKSKNGKWKVNYIQIDEISNKLKYVYSNYTALKEKKQDLLKYDIKNINYWIDSNNP